MPYSETYNTNLDVITLKDNLTHRYFSSISWSKDNYLPLGTAILVMPYMDEAIQYWRTYFDVVVISANMVNSNGQIFVNITNPATLPQSNINDSQNNINSTQTNAQVGSNITNQQQSNITDLNDLAKQANNQASQTSNSQQNVGANEGESFTSDAQINANAPYNYSFIGRVAQVKQRGMSIIITLQDLGWKFLQKVPTDFRNNYIANATLDDAYQAICEFLGVDFMFSIEDLHELTFHADGYSVQKDGETLEDVPTILTEWGDTGEDEESEEETSGLDDPTNENDGLIEYSKTKSSNNKSKTSSSSDSNSNDNSLASNVTNSDSEDEEGDEENEDDDTDTLQEKIDKFQAEFDEKVQSLFMGNMMYNSDLVSNVMDYGSITVAPSGGESTNNNMSSTSGSGTSDDTDSNDESSSSSSSGSKRSYTARAVRNAFKNSTNAMIKSFYNCSSESCVKRLVNSNAKNLKVSKNKAIQLIVDAKKGDGTISTKLQNAIKKAKSSGYSTAKSRR